MYQFSAILRRPASQLFEHHESFCIGRGPITKYYPQLPAPNLKYMPLLCGIKDRKMFAIQLIRNIVTLLLKRFQIFNMNLWS